MWPSEHSRCREEPTAIGERRGGFKEQRGDREIVPHARAATHAPAGDCACVVHAVHSEATPFLAIIDEWEEVPQRVANHRMVAHRRERRDSCETRAHRKETRF